MGGFKMSRYVRVSNENGTFTEKKVYWPEDMEAFAEWVDINGYKQILKGVWNRDISYQQKMTTTQLRETWEEWKAQQRGEETK